jgi:hypothetical protein
MNLCLHRFLSKTFFRHTANRGPWTVPEKFVRNLVILLTYYKILTPDMLQNTLLYKFVL